MKFRLSAIVVGISATKIAAPITFEVSNGITVTFWNSEIRGLSGGVRRELRCDATFERKPNDRVSEITDELLKEGKLRSFRGVTVSEPRFEVPPRDADKSLVGSLKPDITLEDTPESFRSFHQGIYDALNGALQRAVAVLRWRQGLPGDHATIAQSRLSFTVDDESWFFSPRLLATGSVRPIPPIDEHVESLSHYIEFVQNGAEEPLAHELLREASALSGLAARSSLMMAVSALETGVKSYLKSIIPSAEPMLDALVAPRVEDLLRSVIPATHRLLDISPETQYPMDIDYAFLRKWIFQRNQLAHGRKQEINANGLQEFIIFVRRVLYIIDAWMGHGWASCFGYGNPDVVHYGDGRSVTVLNPGRDPFAGFVKKTPSERP